MEDEDKMLFMYQAIQDKPLTDRDKDRLSVERADDEWDSPLVLRYYKDGNVCWEYTKEELLFQYITKSWVKDVEPVNLRKNECIYGNTFPCVRACEGGC